MPILTIFTPTYNRSSTLKRTYTSLLNQTCKDFEWLIIDDGSIDNTRDLVQSWIKEDKIKIKYIWQENQGMHGAHNTAYKNINTELNTCIDSDDWMPENAVQSIIEFWRKYGNDKYAGLIGLDQDVNGTIIGTKFSENGILIKLSEFYSKGGKGDKKLVYRTEIIKKYPPYPLFEGEKYVGLAFLYMLIDQDYSLLTLNEPLVTVDYQQDGSSFNIYSQYWNNPKGFIFYRKNEMKLVPSLKRKFISNIHYIAECRIAREKNYIRKSPKPFLSILAWIPGLLLFKMIKKKIMSNKKFNLK